MHRLGWGLAALAVVAMLTGACSHSKGAAKSTTSTTALTGPKPTPKPSPTEAVGALLTAEQHNDHDASYLLLTPASRQSDFRNTDRWSRRRNELAPITAFKVERTDKDTVVVLVEHKPGLDAFTGLALAKERQLWKTAKAAKAAGGSGGGGYLVDGEPTFQPIYPPDDAAKPAAVGWAQAVQACDQVKSTCAEARASGSSGKLKKRRAASPLGSAKSMRRSSSWETSTGFRTGRSSRQSPRGPISTSLLTRSGTVAASSQASMPPKE